jgi:hypothetical protein
VEQKLEIFGVEFNARGKYPVVKRNYAAESGGEKHAEMSLKSVKYEVAWNRDLPIVETGCLKRTLLHVSRCDEAITLRKRELNLRMSIVWAGFQAPFPPR